MRGNIIYAIQVILFTFLLMRYLYFVFKKQFPKSDKVECYGASLLVSFMVTCMVTVISMVYLESLYFNAWVLFWFINLSMAVVVSRFEIFIVGVLAKKLNQLEKS